MLKTPTPTLSIIIPTYNEEMYIKACIESLLDQNYSKLYYEIIIVDGNSTDGTIEIVNYYSKTFPNIFLIKNPKKTVPYAMNIGINQSKGDYIIRIDAHAIFPKNYLSSLIHFSKKYDSDNIGGVVQTLPANNTNIAIAISVALSHPFGMGNSYFRIGSSKVRKVDTVPFGCFKRSLFNKIGLFDIELTRNQDDEFNGRIINNEGTIYLIPDIIVKYYSRDSISKVANMFYQYGLFKPLVIKKLGKPATIRQIVPTAFTSFLIIFPFVFLVNMNALYLYTSILILYILISLFITFKESLSRRKILVALPYIFIIIHLSYGLGFIQGFYNIISNQRKPNINSNR